MLAPKQLPKPSLYPDEDIFSVIARHHRLLGSRSKTKTFHALFPKSYANRYSFRNFLKGCQFSDEDRLEFMVRTTSIPYDYWCCRDLNCSKSVNPSILSYSDPEIAAIIRNKHYSYKFCLECINEDISNFGVAYWHRIHQTNCVYVCPIHDTILYTRTPYSSKSVGQIELTLPTDHIKSPAHHKPVVSKPIENRFISDLSRIGQFVAIKYDLFYSEYDSIDLSITTMINLQRKNDCTVVDIERGAIGEELRPILLAINEAGKESNRYFPISAEEVNRQISRPWANTIHTVLTSQAFEDKSHVLNTLKEFKTDINSLIKKGHQVKSEIEEGLTVSKAAKRSNLHPMAAWYLTHRLGRPPNERLFWLTPARRSQIADLVAEHYHPYRIGEKLGLPLSHIKLFLTQDLYLRDLHARRGNFETFIRRKRKLLDILKGNFPASVNRIRERAPALFDWINERDPEWITSLRNHLMGKDYIPGYSESHDREAYQHCSPSSAVYYTLNSTQNHWAKDPCYS